VILHPECNTFDAVTVHVVVYLVCVLIGTGMGYAGHRGPARAWSWECQSQSRPAPVMVQGADARRPPCARTARTAPTSKRSRSPGVRKSSSLNFSPDPPQVPISDGDAMGSPVSEPAAGSPSLLAGRRTPHLKPQITRKGKITE